MPEPMVDMSDSTTSDKDIDSYLLSRKRVGPDMGGFTPPQDTQPTQQSTQDFEKMLQSMPKMPSPPKLHDIPSAPQMNYHSPYQDFSGPALFLAALGSLMTRHPMQTSMNAFSAMVKANIEGQKDVMQNARDNWLAATDVAQKQNQVEIDRYKMILEKYHEDASQAAAHMMAMASGFNDPMMAAMVRTGDMANVWNYINDREKRGTQLAEFALKQREEEEKERHNKAMEGGTEGAQNRQARIDAIGNYRAPPISSSNRSPVNQAIMEEVYAQYPDYDATRYNAKNKATGAFSTGKEGGLIRSMNVAISHLDTLEQLSKALANNDAKALNRISNVFQEQFGGTAPGNFEAAKVIVGDEVVKAIIGAGGGVSDREEAKKNIDNAKTPAQLAGVISTYKRLLGGQLEGLKKQYSDTTGRSDFDSRLTPEAKGQLESSPARPASGSVLTPASAGVPPPDQRVKGKIYPTPKGDLRWNGTSWDQP